MGYTYDFLVAPAILYLNPGIDKDEFVRLLSGVKSSYRQYSPEEDWDYFDSEWAIKGLHRKEELASILKLSFSKEYKNFQKNKKDENGLTISAPYFYEISNGLINLYTHKENIIKNSIKLKNEFYFGAKKLKKGDFFGNNIIKQILKEKQLLSKEEIKDYWLGGGPTYEYDLEVYPVKKKEKIEKFSSKEKLYEKYPLFDPENKYNWQKKDDCFETGLLGLIGKDLFFWRQRKGKYYLDEKTFDQIPASFIGYTDLILTAEAIKNKAWKLLSYKGNKYISLFLKDFPSANFAYQRAVWDSHTSLYAKSKQMTINEFLRMRISGL